MIDIVLDTCTLVHANNPESHYQEYSIELITRLLSCTTQITVDNGFELDNHKNKSVIAMEYMKHLVPGMLGYALIQQIAAEQRFYFVERKAEIKINKYVNRLIRNKKDRHFLLVAYNSVEKVLVSHDYSDYQAKKRGKIKQEVSVDILDAKDVISKL